MMIETEVVQIESITVGDLVQYKLDDFMLIMGGNTCLWTSGYLVAYNAVDSRMFDKNLFENKKATYRSVNFTIFPEYQPVYTTSDNMKIPIINYSNSQLGKAVIKFIEDHKE
jgi:hypothetical protein